MAHIQLSNDIPSSAAAVQEISAHLTPEIDDARTATVNVFPDSGASICLGGPKQLHQMGLTISSLRPSNKQVKAVGGSILTCKGWFPVKFELGGYCTTQPLYICEKVDRLYFSKQACMAVNILSPEYPRAARPSQDRPHISSVNEEQATPSLSLPTSSSEAHTESTSKVTTPNTASTTKTNTNPPPENYLPRKPPPPRPATLPFPPLRENVPKLKKYIVDQFGSSAFNDSPPFPNLSGPDGKIHLKPNPVPKAVHSPIPVPHHLNAAVKAGLDRDIARGIIAPVPIGTPVTWCSQMVIVIKPDGTPRRTVDFRHLISKCLRETHHVTSPFHLASQIPPNTYKTVIDAVDGYHSVQLDPESQLLTVFITEWGRFMYLRLPQGFFSAGDIYTRRYDDIIIEVERKVKIVDDALLHDPSIEQSFYHTWDYLTLCAENGIVVNKKKFQFCEQTVEFAGVTITPNGVVPSQKLLSAICEFPTPTDLTSAR